MLDSPTIRTLADGEKITEPGFYRMPLEIHHAQPCDGISVTSSVLRTMELETPGDYWAFSLLNPDRYEKEQTTALRLGRAMAAWVEGGEEEARRHFMVLPETKPNRPTPAQRKAYDEGRATEKGAESVEFWAKVEADPRDHVTAEEWQMICGMGRVLEADPHAAATLGGVPEITAAWFDEINQLWVLSRPDLVNFRGMVSDYKTATPMKRFNLAYCDREITDRGYDMQLSLAAEAMEQLTGDWPDLAAVTFQLKKPPYHVIPRSIEEEDLRIAAWRNRRARARFRECLDSGHWPGPGEVFTSYHRPQWQRDMLLEIMNTEGVAP